MSQDSFYALKTTSLAGKPVELAEYKGQVTLAVNVASECGYTPQYKGLEAPYTELHGRGFSVLGFPSNEFGSQEPGSPEQIQTFCQKNYGVSFPMFSKLATKPGPEQSPLYAFLTTTVPKGETARTVAANNIVNSGAMVLAALLLAVLLHFGVSVADTLLMVAIASIGAAFLAWRLHKACD